VKPWERVRYWLPLNAPEGIHLPGELGEAVDAVEGAPRLFAALHVLQGLGDSPEPKDARRHVLLDEAERARGEDEVAVDALHRRARDLDERATIIQHALNVLDAGGLDYDPNLGRAVVRREKGTSGGRPRSIFDEIVMGLYEALDRNGKLPKPRRAGRIVYNSKPAREEIARILAPYLGPASLDPRPHGPIYVAIRKYLEDH
jgi:hypothetical protein